MSDLAALHAQARRLTLSIRGGLDRLEALEAVRQHQRQHRWAIHRLLGAVHRVSPVQAEVNHLRRLVGDHIMRHWRRRCSRSSPICR